MSRVRQLADNLRRVRELTGMTADQLDDLLGFQRGSVEAYELTQREVTPTALRDLAGALRVPVSRLLEGTW